MKRYRRGGVRHPKATHGDAVHNAISAKSKQLRPRNGDAHSGEFRRAADMLEWAREGWVTNTVDDKTLINHIQTMIGRNLTKWQKKRDPLDARFMLYRNVEF